MSLIPLVSIRKDASQRYSVSFEAIKFLKALKEKKVIIVCNFDSERDTAKRQVSQKMLKISTNPAKNPFPGLSIWGQTMSLYSDVELVVMETEGLEACAPEKLSGARKDSPLPSDLCFIINGGTSKEIPSRQAASELFLSLFKPREKDSEVFKALKSMLLSNFTSKYLIFSEKNMAVMQEIINQKPSIYKSCEGKLLNGPLIYKIVYEATEFLKRNQSINVSEVLELAFSSEAKEIIEDLKKDFQTKVGAELNDEDSPYDIEEMDKIFKLGLHDFSTLIDTRLKGICDVERFIELKNEFFEVYEKDLQNFLENNRKRSREFCDEILSKFFSNVQVNDITSPDAIKPTLVREFEEEFNKLLEIYLANARGPAKFHCLLENMPSFLFQKFQKIYDGICTVFTQENNKTRVSLLQVKEERDKLQSSIKELESLRFEAEQLKENISRESESLKREFDYKLLSKDYNEESLKNALEGKDKLIRKKKEQKKTLKTENAKFRENELKLKHEINLVLNEVTNLKRKNKELERILEEQLFSISRELKGQTQNVEDLLQRKSNFLQQEALNVTQTASSANVDELEEELKHKDMEIEKLKKEKKALKEELATKLDQESRRFSKLKDSLNREIDNLKQEKEEMNKKIINYDSKDEELKSLLIENKKKDQNLEFYQHFLELNKQQIEATVCEIADIKQQNGDLKQFKDSIPFILSEGLRYAMKQTKSSKLAVSLRTMKDEDAKLIMNVFDEVGLHLKF